MKLKNYLVLSLILANNGSYVIQIHPNAASDLIVGSILNRYKDGNNPCVDLGDIHQMKYT